jgi:hypothetical protein
MMIIGRRVQCLVQASYALIRVAQHRLEKWRSAETCILDAVAEGGN